MSELRRTPSMGSAMPGALREELAQLASVASLALPALGIVLVDPLISLVDTACIGRISTGQLAALAPNGAVFNMLFQVFTFVGVSVTNVMACNSPSAPGITEAERKRRMNECSKLQSYGLTSAALCGVVCTFICSTYGRSLLMLMGASEDLVAVGLPYLRIRGAAAPAVLTMNACQGAFLGQQNTATPLLIFASAAAVNAALDVWFVLGLRLGLHGSALATCLVQYASACAFLHALHRQGATGKGVRLMWAGLPTLADLRPFFGVAWKLLTRTLFKMAAFASISATATRLSQTEVATHQIALQLFWLVSFFPEPLSMSAQSLIARDTTDRGRVTRTAWLLLRLAGFLSISLAAVVALTFLFGAYLFSPDQDVVDGVQELVVPAMTAIVACTYVMQCDGIFIGSLDFSHLPRTNLVAWVVCGWLLWYGEKHEYKLVWIWWAMAAFFAVRLVQHVLHAVLNLETSAFGAYNRPSAVTLSNDEEKQLHADT